MPDGENTIFNSDQQSIIHDGFGVYVERFLNNLWQASVTPLSKEACLNVVKHLKKPDTEAFSHRLEGTYRGEGHSVIRENFKKIHRALHGNVLDTDLTDVLKVHDPRLNKKTQGAITQAEKKEFGEVLLRCIDEWHRNHHEADQRSLGFSNRVGAQTSNRQYMSM
ncbi:MAG: hypothetical protein IPP74_10365 [Alphaproteobacteria bacterium]|nr:hypothetical protein [Alphaproteobacteria bacterium]